MGIAKLSAILAEAIKEVYISTLKKHDEYVVLVHAMILLVYDQNTSSMVDIKKTWRIWI